MRISGKRSKVVLSFSPVEKHQRVYSSITRYVDHGKLHMIDDELVIGKHLGVRQIRRIK